jgi:mannose-6-phosphate isomerase-like protein (cupin superfamily)
MGIEQSTEHLKIFTFGGREYPVSFVETMHIADGVDCDVYAFGGDVTKDLGIIRIAAGHKTPLQRVLNGDKTIEGYRSGRGKFTVTASDKKSKVYNVGEDFGEGFSVAVQIGETMQWEADKDSDLVAYEICFPPYTDGRYENIE